MYNQESSGTTATSPYDYTPPSFDNQQPPPSHTSGTSDHLTSVTLQTPRMQNNNSGAVSSDDYQAMVTPSFALQDRTRLILDIIMLVLCILLIIFSIDCLFIGSVGAGVYNKLASGLPRRMIANIRFSAAAGIIGGFFAFVSAIIGIASIPFRKATPMHKKLRIVFGILFVLSILWTWFIHFLCAIVAMAVKFQIDTNVTNAQGAAWLLLGVMQFLVIFYGGMIAFAIVRIVFDARQKMQ